MHYTKLLTSFLTELLKKTTMVNSMLTEKNVTFNGTINYLMLFCKNYFTVKN